METKWYENIPQQGVLCKESGTGFIFAVSHEMVSTAPSLKDIDRLTPLTAAEWWQFAPWQSMSSAPRDGSLLLIWCLHAWHIGYYDSENECFASCEFLLLGAEKWLPLPTGDL